VLPPEPPPSRIDPPLPVVPVGPLVPDAPPAPAVVVELVDPEVVGPVVADDEPVGPVPALDVPVLEVELVVDPVPLVAPPAPESSHMSTLGSHRAVPPCVHPSNAEARTTTPKPNEAQNGKLRGMCFLTA
jgi:hypothetical protein